MRLLWSFLRWGCVMYDKSTRCRGVLAIGFCVFLCAAGAARLHAQTGDGAATIAGAVVDVAGKPIANAAVSVKNESTGSVRQATSDNDGRFSVTGLTEGLYTIEASAPSFATSRRTRVKMGAGRTENLSVSLNLRELSHTMTLPRP